MTFKFANNARSLLAAAISNTDLSFSVTGGDGSKFPSSGNFRVMLVKATGVREIVEVESRSTDSFTIRTGGRGLEGTVAQTYSAGDVTAGVAVKLVASRGVLENFVQMVLGWSYRVIFNTTGLSADRTLVVPNKNGTLMVVEDVVSEFTTGDVKLTYKATADAGWIMADDGSIGNASSGATSRANADTAALFTLLYNNITALVVQDSGGSTVSRGANAAADFAANRRLVIPKALGRALGVAGAGASLTSRALGSIVGAETHTLTIPEMPAHTHNVENVMAHNGGNYAAFSNISGPATLTTTSTGGGQAHNNMQPTTFLNVMIKL